MVVIVLAMPRRVFAFGRFEPEEQTLGFVPCGAVSYDYELNTKSRMCFSKVAINVDKGRDRAASVVGIFEPDEPAVCSSGKARVALD